MSVLAPGFVEGVIRNGDLTQAQARARDGSAATAEQGSVGAVLQLGADLRRDSRHGSEARLVRRRHRRARSTWLQRRPIGGILRMAEARNGGLSQVSSWRARMGSEYRLAFQCRDSAALGARVGRGIEHTPFIARTHARRDPHSECRRRLLLRSRWLGQGSAGRGDLGRVGSRA